MCICIYLAEEEKEYWGVECGAVQWDGAILSSEVNSTIQNYSLGSGCENFRMRIMIWFFLLCFLGVLGIKVKIMLPWDPNGKMGPKKPLPDNVSVVEPKEEILPTVPSSDVKASKPDAPSIPGATTL